jgi:carbamoyl-phosphate synthase large subunit
LLVPVKRRPCRVLLTSVGGLISPQMITLLRESTCINPTILGVDVSADAVGRHFVDGFETAPRGDSIEYPPAIMDLCRRNSVEIVVPCSDEEAISLSAAVPAFRLQGIHILCSSRESTVEGSNKHTYLSKLKAAGLPVPQYHVPRSLAELDYALEGLGFPEHDVVIKPLSRSGSRGVRILRGGPDQFSHVFDTKQETCIAYERLVRLLEQSEIFPQLLVMERLTGGIFNVDVLCDNGRCVYMVPQRKLPPEHGSLQNCRLEYVEEVEELTRRVVRVFGFDHLVNLEHGIRHLENDQTYLAFEANVRTSATITMTRASGCYLLEEAICRLMGINTGRSARRSASIKRHWTEWHD